MPATVRIMQLDDLTSALWMTCGWHSSQLVMEDDVAADCETVGRELLAFAVAHTGCKDE